MMEKTLTNKTAANKWFSTMLAQEYLLIASFGYHV